MLRYVDDSQATVWVETDERCEVEVAGHTAPTFEVAGHHYALVVLRHLSPGSSPGLYVRLDGEHVWPEATSSRPPSSVRLFDKGDALKLYFGSCRVADPDGSRPASQSHFSIRSRGLDTLRALAQELSASAPDTWPDLLLLAGDQVYADDVSPRTARFIKSRRGKGRRRRKASPPLNEVADFEEYAYLYREAWSDPPVRWLLSTIPSAMIFDDHDIRDDWNTSDAWRTQMWKEPWWEERIASGLMAYWVYQHIGNLSPDELASDALFSRAAIGDDITDALREFALEADRHPQNARWSYSRTWARVRLVVVDSRSSRVVREGERDMLDQHEWKWLEDEVRGDVDHLLLATSLPLLMPHAIHDVEAWNEATCASTSPLSRWLGERLRQAVDLEHWAAFQQSFARLCRLTVEVARGSFGVLPPASVVILSGDVHYAYMAEADLSPWGQTSRLHQLVCSPVRNRVERRVLLLNHFAASRIGQWLGRSLARRANIQGPFNWSVVEGPWFGNEIMSLTISGRKNEVRLQRPLLQEGRLTLGDVAVRDLSGG